MKFIKPIVSTLLVCFALSCAENGKTELTYYSDGAIQNKITYLNDSTALIVNYYNNGIVKTSMTLINKKSFGRIKGFFQDGKLATDCYYKNDLKNGPCVTYFPSGNLKDSASFSDSVMIGNAYDYYDLPGKKIRFVGNYAKVNGKKWVNYTTLYDSLGNIEKASVQIREIKGEKKVSIKDSLKITFDLDYLELPLVRAFIGNYDKDYTLSEDAKEKIYEGKGKTIVAYIVPAKLGKHTARGYVQNYKVVEKFKDGTYKTYGKDIYWSYDYEVTK